MIDAISISGNGLRANQAWIDSISNNIANIQTSSFKRTVVQFEDLVAGSVDGSSLMNVQSGMGASANASSMDVGVGQIKRTGDNLHVAINGGGFIEVVGLDGETKYSRGGVLTVSTEGQLLASGLEISSQIVLPPDASKIDISNEGVVEVMIGPGADRMEVGRIELVQFSSPNMLSREGGGLYSANDNSGEAIFTRVGDGSVGQIMQGYLEMSNVELVDEMTSLVMAQRAYQLNARVIQTADQVLETINNLRR